MITYMVISQLYFDISKITTAKRCFQIVLTLQIVTQCTQIFYIQVNEV